MVGDVGVFDSGLKDFHRRVRRDRTSYKNSLRPLRSLRLRLLVQLYVIVPTYNEKENLPKLIEQLLALPLISK